MVLFFSFKGCIIFMKFHILYDVNFQGLIFYEVSNFYLIFFFFISMIELI